MTRSAWFEAVRCPLCRDRGIYARWSIELPGGEIIEPDEHNDGDRETLDGVPYWAPGEPIHYRSQVLGAYSSTGDLVDGFSFARLSEREQMAIARLGGAANSTALREYKLTRWVEEAPCSCTATVSAYDERKQERADRREAKAAALRQQAEQDQKRSRAMLPDFGQPILVGHHSEGRHRRALERSAALMHRAVADTREAARLEQMAHGARGTSEISSDDPHAPAKYRARAWLLELQHEARKAERKAARKRGEKVERDGGHDSANIRRMRKRADEIEAMRARVVPADFVIGDLELTWNTEENRVQFFSPRPTDGDRRDMQRGIMRSAGFVWSGRNGCWQRQASMQAWHLGKAAIEQLAKVGL